VSRWIVSARQDLVWFHGSVLAGVALCAVLAAAPPVDARAGLLQPALLAVVLWGVFFDGTHVVGTWARTYWAGDAAARAGLPGAWSWAILLVGPALAFHEGAFGAFLVAAYLWAFYHLVRSTGASSRSTGAAREGPRGRRGSTARSCGRAPRIRTCGTRSPRAMRRAGCRCSYPSRPRPRCAHGSTSWRSRSRRASSARGPSAFARDACSRARSTC
jgi:hypothetical protein